VSSIPLAPVEGTTKGEDVDAGQLFDVPRVKVVIDESDPNVIKLRIGGSVELDRTNREQVDFYNSLKHGGEHELVVTVHVAGARKVHRRDSEGDVDAIVETKSCVVTDVYVVERTE
jgi:hypothetical protein